MLALYLTLGALCLAPASAMGITRRLDGSACADEPGATLPGGWDCARIAEYIGSRVDRVRLRGRGQPEVRGRRLVRPREQRRALLRRRRLLRVDVPRTASKNVCLRPIGAKEDQYAPVTRAISEEDLVAPEEDVERGPTLEDKRRMLD